MFIFRNPNPCGSYVGDCVVRALSIALDLDWYEVYMQLAIQGFSMCDMPSSNKVWGELLKSYGYHRYIIPDTCPKCYTIKDFAGEHFKGTYIVCTGTHTCAIIDGNYIDSWNSGDETPVFYWHKEE
jgi:hypothetical protein